MIRVAGYIVGIGLSGCSFERVVDWSCYQVLVFSLLFIFFLFCGFMIKFSSSSLSGMYWNHVVHLGQV